MHVYISISIYIYVRYTTLIRGGAQGRHKRQPFHASPPPQGDDKDEDEAQHAKKEEEDPNRSGDRQLYAEGRCMLAHVLETRAKVHRPRIYIYICLYNVF